MKRQEEMIQNLLLQIGQLGAQNQGATRVQNGVGPSGTAQELGGTYPKHVDPIPGAVPGGAAQRGVDREANARSGEQTLGIPRELRGQIGNDGQGLQLGDSDRLAEMVR